ncbi:cell division protein FtsK [Pseudactinotalea sp. Z1748]|uniref:cell division protein FtsK n=1 Tax=Pseudactinotalea sp. Z1748 TaxID=3413027 RepID=UPI003C7B11BE
MASKIERISVKLPAGFDARKHTNAVLAKISQKHGEGWEVDSIDPKAGTLTASRFAQVTEVSATESANTMVLGLARGTKPSDGEKIAAKFEDAHPGYKLTKFDPYLGQATMTKLTGPVIRAREAIRVALGVKPWDVQVRQTRDGGFAVELPNSYVPSKHDDKLTEVAEGVIGRPGWFVTTDPAKLNAKITPADPPTFPAAIPYPMDKMRGLDHNYIPIGMDLPGSGEKTGRDTTISFKAASYMLLGGIPQSGKSVTLDTIVAGSLASGSELILVDTPEKSVDFLWCRDLVRPGGWGCDSLEAAVTALALMYEEGQRRASILREHKVVNWTELPKSVQFSPLIAIVDEYAALVGAEKVPSGIPKTHPIVQEALQTNLLKAQLERWVSKITAEMRFVGLRMVLSSQVTNATTGLPPAMKAKLGHRYLMGANPSKAARNQSFNDESAVPFTPEYIRKDEAISRGVGAYESEGRSPSVFKSYFASSQEYRKVLGRLGVPTTNQPAPTAEQIARHTPSLDDDGMDDGPPPSRLDGSGWGEQDGRDAPPPKLKGAAAAAHQLRVEAAQTAQRG